MAQVDGEAHPAGHGVARARIGLELADRRPAIGAVGVGDLVDLLEHGRRGAQRIAPPFHGRRTGMGLGAQHFGVVPAGALAAGDDADPTAFRLEDRPLLDVQLEQRPRRPAADRLLARVADPRELGAQRLAAVILARQGVVESEHARKHARCDHRRRKPAALLVGPVDHLERCPGPDAMIVEGPDHLERGQHAERAVELAASRLTVEVAAEQDRRPGRVGALPAGEHAAHAIDAECEPRRLAPAREQIAAALVLVGQRLAVDPAVRGRADLGHGHQAAPQPLAVRPHLGHDPTPRRLSVRFVRAC